MFTKKVFKKMMKQHDKQVRESSQQAENTYNTPPINLLQDSLLCEDIVKDDVLLTAQLVEKTLKELDIASKVVGIVRGKQVTRFEIELPAGVRVRTLLDKEEEIQKILAPNSKMRLLTPIPGKRAVGIELPNATHLQIPLKEVLDLDGSRAIESYVTFALGKDINDRIIDCDVGRLSNLLIAGGAKDERTNLINNLVVSLIFRLSPKIVRFVMVGEGLSRFDGLPHNLTSNAITSLDELFSRFDWVKEEMERRYKIFQKYNVRGVKDFNRIGDVENGKTERLPYIIVLVDELSFIMKKEKQRFEASLISIAQKLRLAGIHLVFATDDLSVDVTSGTIKASFASRIAFATKNIIESRTILDQSGAEKLLGSNDILYLPIGAGDPIRIQGASISKEEVEKVVTFVKMQQRTDG